MKTKHLDEFYKEVQSIEIKFLHIEGEVPSITLSHYDQHEANYDLQVTRQRELALSVILSMAREQIQNNVNRLELINEKLTRFWQWFSEEFANHQKGNFYKDEFIYKLDGFLKINISKVDIAINQLKDVQGFFLDLHDAVMYKQGAVKYLLFELESITSVKSTLASNTEERAEVEKDIMAEMENMKKFNIFSMGK